MKKVLCYLVLLMHANLLISQYISTDDALSRETSHITKVSGTNYVDNSGAIEQTYDARNWSTNSPYIYPAKVGNNTPGTRQVWVGGTVTGPQARTIPWDIMKADYDGTAMLINSKDFLVIDGIRTDNVMDAVRPRGNSSRFRLSNAWSTYTRDDAIENDNMMGGIIEDCLFDGCFMFLSQQGSMTWSTTDSLEVSKTLVRLEPMPYTKSVSGKTPSFESTYGVNADRHAQLFKHHDSQDAPLIVHDCVFYVPQYSLNGSNSMDFPSFDGCKYSNNILLWTGGGSYPGKLPASGVTEYNLINSTQQQIDQMWNDSVDVWIARHSDSLQTYQLTVNNGSGDGFYSSEEEVIIHADPAPDGKEFEKWTGDVDYIADQYDSITTVTMPLANISLTANFLELATYQFLIPDREILVYPNPATDRIIITNVPDNGLVNLMNANGLVIDSFIPSFGKVVLEMNNNAKGVYFVSVLSEGTLQTNKLIIL